MKGKLFLKSACGAIALCLAITSCGKEAGNGSSSHTANTSAAPAAREEKTGTKILRFGQAPYDTLDMQVSTSSLSAAIADEVVESLLRFNDNNSEECVLIKDFPSVSEDGTV